MRERTTPKTLGYVLALELAALAFVLWVLASPARTGAVRSLLARLLSWLRP